MAHWPRSLIWIPLTFGPDPCFLPHPCCSSAGALSSYCTEIPALFLPLRSGNENIQRTEANSENMTTHSCHCPGHSNSSGPFPIPWAGPPPWGASAMSSPVPRGPASVGSEALCHLERFRDLIFPVLMKKHSCGRPCSQTWNDLLCFLRYSWKTHHLISGCSINTFVCFCFPEFYQ